MKFAFETLNIIRKNTLDAIASLSDDQLRVIPQNFNNNILWNLGHMVASQQILCYKLGNAPLLLPQTFVDKFRKGTSPKDWTEKVELKEIKEYLKLTGEHFFEDYQKGIFSNYSPYPTSSGAVLSSIDDAVIYNYGHENLHYGIILALKKLV